jgi:hypothetical protein
MCGGLERLIDGVRMSEEEKGRRKREHLLK